MTTRRSDQARGAERPGGQARAGRLAAPGGVVGDGRYRLLAQFGVDERSEAHLWRARDGQLRRDVALTLLVGDASDTAAAQAARETLERAAHAAQFCHPAVSRVLDVLTLGNGITATEGLLGIVVADWTQGTDLVDLSRAPVAPAATATGCSSHSPTPSSRPTTRASCSVLDHPQRLRLDADGMLRLAFPGPLPDSASARRRQGPRRDPVPAADRPLVAAGRTAGHPGGARRPRRPGRAAARTGPRGARRPVHGPVRSIEDASTAASAPAGHAAERPPPGAPTKRSAPT